MSGATICEHCGVGAQFHVCPGLRRTTVYSPGAASRSEQSAASKIHSAADCPYGVEAHGFMGEHGSPAAEAAQSPQEGAGQEEEWWAFAQGAIDMWESGALDLKGAILGAIGAAIRAHAGRSVSDRPPASESPGPLAALREAVRRLLPYVESSVELLADEAEPDEIEDARDAVTAARAALRESSAERGGVANESGGAARGSPEEGT
jgi:hypothetical protein